MDTVQKPITGSNLAFVGIATDPAGGRPLVVIYGNFKGKSTSNFTIISSSYHDSTSHNITSSTSIGSVANYFIVVQIYNNSAAGKYCIIDMTIT